jgi:hypothetical protein
MVTDSYNYIALANKTVYYFQSEGKNGKILKVVIFNPITKNLWNLAFGDVINDEIDDTVISNNYDFVKLFGTIAKVVYEFSDNFPLRRIYIEPVDEKRKQLYNHIFRRHYTEINHVFFIEGYLNDKKEQYSPEKFYDYFILKRNFVK